MLVFDSGATSLAKTSTHVTHRPFVSVFDSEAAFPSKRSAGVEGRILGSLTWTHCDEICLMTRRSLSSYS